MLSITFELARCHLLVRYESHANKLYKVEATLSNDDAYVISGSEDNNIYFWNLVEVNHSQCFGSSKYLTLGQLDRAT